MNDRADTHHTFLRRPPSSPADTGARATVTGLPPDLLDKARDRVKLIALLMLGGIMVAQFSDVPADGLRSLAEDRDDAGSWVIAVMSASLYLLARNTRLQPWLVLKLGLLYEIALCMLFSLLVPFEFYDLAVEMGVTDRFTDVLPFLSWTTPVIIMFPLIVPSTPRTTLIVAILAAATTPVGLGVFEISSGFDVELRAYPHTTLSPILAVAIAYFGSRVVYSMGMDVTRAREMGSYQLETQLGAGGMGEVWRARHRMLARPAAIKLVKPEVLGAATPESRTLAIKRFEREAQATASMRSPHTIELYDFGETDEGTFYYVMELLDGYDLDTLVRQFGPVPPERAVHLLRQVCHSLAEAHESDLIHRDIKPANIFVCRYGREVDFVKLLDFGLVKVQAEPSQEDHKLTVGDFAGGTPAYIAPEQASGDGSVDGRTDIYAVGCVAYWLLTGKLVFEGGIMQMIADHVHAPPTPPSQRAKQAIPQSLETIVMSCLEKHPDRRPQSADALLDALNACNSTEPWSQERARAWWEERSPGKSAAV